MATPTNKSINNETLALAFRNRLEKISETDSTHDYTQQVMLALGYALQLTPTGNPGFTRKAKHKGLQVNVWVADAELTVWPQSLLSSVWVGYYSTDDGNEMLDDQEYARLIDYLLEFHPEAFSDNTTSRQSTV